MKTHTNKGWGPQRKSGAVSVSFDNLGEACDIAMGNWPADQALGCHFTATEVLPRLLRELHGLPVSYFVEASNIDLYPQQLASLRAAGHEIGLHAWQHENWAGLTLEQQEQNLTKSLAKMASIGIRPLGFRPPGGVINHESIALLKRHGFQYCSSVASDSRSSIESGVVVLPFEWKHVDAYLCDPILGQFRVACGDTMDPTSADRWSEILQDAKSAAQEQEKHVVIIFHAYMVGKDARLWESMRAFLQDIRTSDDLWLAPCHEVAEWILTNR